MSATFRLLSFSDQQVDAIMNAARPLEPVDREPFLRALAVLFNGRMSVGDGELHRGLVMLQKEFFRPPEINGSEAPRQLARKLR